MNPNNFFSELKRRNVYKVAVAYAIVGWLLVQVATQVLPFLEIPNWAIRLVILLVLIGFPIAVVIAWAFELTPTGLKKTETADAMGASSSRGRAWLYVVLVAAVLSIGLFFVGRSFIGADREDVHAKSIAILPFDNLSHDPENAYFAEGVQDEILTRLARVADLKVISRTSTQKYKSAPDNLREIAKQLGVAHIVEGSVQKSGDQVRVNVQLLNALTDAHLWAEIYDRKLTDIFTVESEIAKTIADTLQAKLTGTEKQMMAAQPTSDMTAYELYHKGHSLWEQRSGDNLPRAISFFEQAIAHDPNYALAYAGLANAQVLLPYYTDVSRNEPLNRAKESALKALSLDPNLAEAHAALGKVHYFQLDLAGAIPEYQRAIQLKPNYATAHQWYGNDALVSFGRFDEAIAEGRRSVELDPQSPVINADFGLTLYLARHYDEAIAQFHKALALDPAFFYAHYNLGIALQGKGDLRGAIAEFERASQLSDDPLTVALLGAAKALAGDKNAAQQTLQDLAPGGRYRGADDYSRALLYLSLNNKDEALRAVERAIAARDGSNIGWIKVDPMLDPLRGDPRFDALVQRVIAPKTQ